MHDQRLINHQEIPASDDQLQILNFNMKADHSFTLDMDPSCNLTNKEHSLSSRIIRSPSRKESQKGSEKKMMNLSYNVMYEGDGSDANNLSPNKAAGGIGGCLKLMGGSMPEKAMIDETTTSTTTDQMMQTPHSHHQITIITPTTKITSTTHDRFWKRSRSFKQSSIINPTRILFFFATLSSIGTVLLICLTLSMSRYNENDNLHA